MAEAEEVRVRSQRGYYVRRKKGHCNRHFFIGEILKGKSFYFTEVNTEKRVSELHLSNFIVKVYQENMMQKDPEELHSIIRGDEEKRTGRPAAEGLLWDPYRDSKVAHGAFGRAPKPERTKRTCLMCGELFPSEGPSNRQCGQCQRFPGRAATFFDKR